MLNKFIESKLWPAVTLAFSVVLFWHPILFNNAFFYDDWDFIKVFEGGKFSLQYILAPHNQHLMILFKPLFFLMFLVFGKNIVPYMMLSIAMHVANALLMFYLCKLIFSSRRWIPFLTAAFFALNSAYFEVLHWFVVFNSALCLFFLLISLILLHKAVLDKKGWMLYASAVSSFFIPLGFSLGILGIVFILLYAKLVLKQLDVRMAVPYIIAWLLFMMLFVPLVIFSGNVESKNVVISVSRVLQTVAFGMLGSWFKTMGFSEVASPYGLFLSVILTLQSIFLMYFLTLYFILNPRKERIKVFGERGLMWFCLTGALLSYLVLGFSRTSLNMDSFVFWGRYHYFPLFFFSILAGSSALPLLNILKKVFKERRARGFLIFVFVVFLLTHLILIRSKSFASFRVEGSLQDEGVKTAATFCPTDIL